MLWRERTQILLCRFGFVVACMAPTMLVLYWALSVRSGAHQRAVADRIRQAFGVPITVGQVVYPRAGLMRCLQVEAQSPDSDKTLLTIPQLELVETPAGYSLAADRVAASSAIVGPMAD